MMLRERLEKSLAEVQSRKQELIRNGTRWLEEHDLAAEIVDHGKTIVEQARKKAEEYRARFIKS